MNHKSLRDKDIVWAPLVVARPHVTGATAHVGHGHQVSPSHAMRGGCHKGLMTIRMSLGWSGAHHDDTLHNADTTELVPTLACVSHSLTCSPGQPRTWVSPWHLRVATQAALGRCHQSPQTSLSALDTAQRCPPHISQECVYPMLTHLENWKTLGWV